MGIAAGIYLLCSGTLGKETASWLCILCAAPAAVAGFFSYNGMTFEKFLWAVIKTEFLCAGTRVFRSENLYYELTRKEGAACDKNPRNGKAQ